MFRQNGSSVQTAIALSVLFLTLRSVTLLVMHITLQLNFNSKCIIIIIEHDIRHNIMYEEFMECTEWLSNS